MLKFTYTVKINALPAYGDKKHIETLSGELLASDHAQAEKQAKSCAFARCKQLEKERGDIFGYENVRVEYQTAQEPEAITLAELMQRRKERREIQADTKVICTVSDIHDYTVTLLNEVHAEIHAGLTQIWRNSNISKWSGQP